MNLRAPVFASALALALGLAASLGDPADACVLDKVRFRYRPDHRASSVHVAGSFNEWNKSSHALRDDDGDGTWELELELEPGRHAYKFVVDGNDWRPDPDAAETDDDGHGGQNSVLVVGEGSGAAPAGESSVFGSTAPRDDAFVGEIFLIEPGTQRLPKFEGDPIGKIYAERLDVAPRSFDEGFPGVSERFEWFAIRYRGWFEATRKGRYRFRLLADDGARLIINGKLVIDNDGLHPPESKSQMIELKPGKYEMIIDYMQGPALDVALQLFVTEPGSTEEKPVRASRPKSMADEKKKRGRGHP